MGSYTGTVPSFPAGSLPDAADFLEVTNYMTASTAVWSTAAPTWTASAGTPAIGNGTLAGRYRRLGKTVDFRIFLQAGTTTTFGTAGAFFNFTVPGGGTAAGFMHGPCRWFDASASQSYLGLWEITSGGTTMVCRRAAIEPATEFLNNAPFTLATSDIILLDGTVEIA